MPDKVAVMIDRKIAENIAKEFEQYPDHARLSFIASDSEEMDLTIGDIREALLPYSGSADALRKAQVYLHLMKDHDTCCGVPEIKALVAALPADTVLPQPMPRFSEILDESGKIKRFVWKNESWVDLGNISSAEFHSWFSAHPAQPKYDTADFSNARCVHCGEPMEGNGYWDSCRAKWPAALSQQGMVETVPHSVYLSAVQGRVDFRNALRNLRHHVIAVCDREIAGAEETLKLDLTPDARRSADGWLNAAKGIKIALLKTPAKSVELPQPNQDQIEYLECILASSDYDPTTIIGDITPPQPQEHIAGSGRDTGEWQCERCTFVAENAREKMAHQAGHNNEPADVPQAQVTGEISDQTISDAMKAFDETKAGYLWEKLRAAITAAIASHSARAEEGQ